MMNLNINNIGMCAIVLGIIHFIGSGFLSFSWGIVLIIFGIFALIYKKPIIFLIFGIMLFVCAFSNISSSLIGIFFLGESVMNYLWIIFGGLQIYWGVTIIRDFIKIKEKSK